MTFKKFMEVYPPKRVLKLFILNLTRLPMFPATRGKLLKLGGVDIKGTVYIHDNVRVDTVHPENIHIGHRTGVSSGTQIITHYLDTNRAGKFYNSGHVRIGEHVVLGINVIICSPVTIGDGAIVGAGSIVTKDIPPYQVWAGNPARYIKDRPKPEDWSLVDGLSNKE